MSRVWILGAADPEMAAIESLLRECGEHIAYASDERGERVHAGSAYRATGSVDEAGAVVDLAGKQVYLVECAVAGADGVIIDHHRPGDPGYGRPPSDYFAASSIGQVVSALGLAILYGYREDAVRILADHEGGRAIETSWSGVGDIPAAGGGVFRSVLPGAQEWPYGKWGLWHGVDLPAHMDRALEGIDASEVLMTAAADHCLGAAYRGECPGVDPDALMRWRAASRARHQGRSVDDVLADVERAQEALRAAPEVVLKQTTMCPWHALGHSPEQDCQNEDGTDYADACCRYVVARDMRTCPRCDGRGAATGASEADGYDPCGPCHAGPRGPVPELVEAATRLDVGYISGPLAQPDGRKKITCSGSAEQVRAFLEHWAPAQGLTGLYGDPARGFAGGYLASGGGHAPETAERAR